LSVFHLDSPPFGWVPGLSLTPQLGKRGRFSKVSIPLSPLKNVHYFSKVSEHRFGYDECFLLFTGQETLG